MLNLLIICQSWKIQKCQLFIHLQNASCSLSQKKRSSGGAWLSIPATLLSRWLGSGTQPTVPHLLPSSSTPPFCTRAIGGSHHSLSQPPACFSSVSASNSHPGQQTPHWLCQTPPTAYLQAARPASLCLCIQLPAAGIYWSLFCRLPTFFFSAEV